MYMLLTINIPQFRQRNGNLTEFICLPFPGAFTFCIRPNGDASACNFEKYTERILILFTADRSHATYCVHFTYTYNRNDQRYFRLYVSFPLHICIFEPILTHATFK